MEDVAMTCAKMCGVQLAIVDVLTTKPLLYQFALKMIKFIENKKTRTWVRNNMMPLRIYRWFSWKKTHQFFQLLASFLQNSINTNKVELGLADLDDKHVKTAIKLASKFFKKMVDHINKNSVPKEVPTFAKSLFVEQTSGGFATALPAIVAPRSNPTVQPTTSKEGGKRKTNGDEPAVVVPGNKKPRKEFSDKSLKMDIFHVKAGTPVAKALPDKTLLADSAGICLDFCSQDKNAISHISCARMASITPTGRTCLTQTSSSFINSWTARVSCGLTQ
jgi:hypothetical protein